jgi:hypothetical protein
VVRQERQQPAGRPARHDGSDQEQRLVQRRGGQPGAELPRGRPLLGGQIAQLVQAMATYQSANVSFNPTTATAMPANTTLQNAIAAE